MEWLPVWGQVALHMPRAARCARRARRFKKRSQTDTCMYAGYVIDLGLILDGFWDHFWS